MKGLYLATLMLFIGLYMNVNANDGINVVKNGDFETEGAMAGASNWTRGNPQLVKFVLAEGNRFCRIEALDPVAAIIMQTVDVEKDWKSVDFSVRLRAKNVKTGAEDWQTGQFQFLFFNEAGKVVGGWKRLKATKDIDDWKVLKMDGLAVPSGAVKLKLQIGVWGASGTFDFDDIKVVVKK